MPAKAGPLSELYNDIRTFSDINQYPDAETSIKALALFDCMEDNKEVNLFLDFLKEADPRGKVRWFLCYYIDLVRYPAFRTRH